MKPSFPDIFTGWKINQVLPPKESMTAFAPAPAVCSKVGRDAGAPWGAGNAEQSMQGHRCAGLTSQDLLPQRVHNYEREF